MGQQSLFEVLKGNHYPGRGIVMGVAADGKTAVMAYFIMGHSENSRNRIFVREDQGIRTRVFDENKLTDPSLILYAPVRVLGDTTIVTNGDQTDTIYEGLKAGKRFAEALAPRTFEPDAPNYTPRISGLMQRTPEGFQYELSILKSNKGNPNSTLRCFFCFEHPLPGEGHLIHTYREDGNPLPSFEGEPIAVALSDPIDAFSEKLWDSLDSDNRISLFVRFLHLEKEAEETRIFNKNS